MTNYALVTTVVATRPEPAACCTWASCPAGRNPPKPFWRSQILLGARDWWNASHSIATTILSESIDHDILFYLHASVSAFINGMIWLLTSSCTVLKTPSFYHDFGCARDCTANDGSDRFQFMPMFPASCLCDVFSLLAGSTQALV